MATPQQAQERARAIMSKRMKTYNAMTFTGLQKGEYELLMADILDEVVTQTIKENNETIIKEIKEHGADFWDDEDHAVGGYISKKDIINLIKNR